MEQADATELTEVITKITRTLELCPSLHCAEVGVCRLRTSGIGIIVRYAMKSDQTEEQHMLFYSVCKVSKKLNYKLYTPGFGISMPYSRIMHDTAECALADVVMIDYAINRDLLPGRIRTLWTVGTWWNRMRNRMRNRIWCKISDTFYEPVTIFVGILGGLLLILSGVVFFTLWIREHIK